MNNPRKMLIVVCAAMTMTTAVAAEYPARPIRYIVPFAPGGGPDVIARLLATDLSQQIGQQIVIDNRPGAGGSMGTEMIVRAAPDGYTISMGNITTLAINPSVLAKLPYDPTKDLQKVVQTIFAPIVLAVTPALPVRSVQELIDYAKKNPGKLSFGSMGNGSSLHLSGELFQFMTGTQMVHVPYKATQQAITEMIGGQLQLMFDNMPSILPHVKAATLPCAAVTAWHALFARGKLTAGEAQINPQMILAKRANVHGIQVGSREMFDAMNRAISQAQLKPIIDRQFEFGDARAAYDYLASRAHFGKIVIRGA